MNRSSKLYRHTAMLCVCITFLLGVGKAVAGSQQGDLALPVSGQPVPFTQDECNQLASIPSQPTLASLQCGDDSGDALLIVFAVIGLLVLIAAAAAPDEEET